MLKGFHYPLTPKGKSTLNPPPPWNYSADFINIEFWSDPAAVAAVLPPGLDPDPAAEGHGNALFYDRQFSGANEEYLDPARYQYREFFLLFDALFKGKPVAYCPYIFVDNDAAIHAAAGGVGFLVTQMAKLCGARVFATVSTGEKAELARRAGADEIIIYTQTNFDEEVVRPLMAGESMSSTTAWAVPHLNNRSDLSSPSVCLLYMELRVDQCYPSISDAWGRWGPCTLRGQQYRRTTSEHVRS